MTDKVSMLESIGSVVRVAVETSEAQIEVELVPTVELMNYWPKRARWPRLFRRWPSAERARCIKVSVDAVHWLCQVLNNRLFFGPTSTTDHNKNKIKIKVLF